MDSAAVSFFGMPVVPKANMPRINTNGSVIDDDNEFVGISMPELEISIPQSSSGPRMLVGWLVGWLVGLWRDT
jgi:hypothetical protein